MPMHIACHLIDREAGYQMKILWFTCVVLPFVVACGGGGNSTTPEDNASSSSLSSSSSSSSSSVAAQLLEGVFKDSAVQGLNFETESVSGTTDANGTFSYQEGESIAFSVGDMVLATVTAAAEITPFTLAGASDVDGTVAANIARLLQALDEDGDATNGISISAQAHTQATGMSVDFSASTFDDSVANLVANSGAVMGVLPSRVVALQHLATNFGAEAGCTANHARVGEIAVLDNVAHGVSGTALIVDDCTMLLTHFNFDGGGLPDVFLYSGQAGDYTNGAALGDNMYEQPQTDATVVVPVTSSLLDGMDGISVWCVQASVSFGDGLFSPLGENN